MRNEQLTRRDAMRLGGALAGALAAGTAGCVEQVQDRVQDAVPIGGPGGAVGKVPDGAESIFFLDVAGALEDETVNSVVNTYLSAYAEQQRRYYDYQGPEDLEGALEQFEDETDLDPKSLQNLTGFYEYDGESPDDRSFGAIVNAEWDRDDIEAAIEESSGRDVETDEYNGKTVLVSPNEHGPDAYVGILDATTFAVGTEDSVEAIIDVVQGDESALSGELKSAHNALPSGYATYTTEVPSTDAIDRADRRRENVDLGPLNDVDITGGSLYVDGETVGLEWHLVAGDAEEAEAILESLQNGRDELIAELKDSEAEQADTAIEEIESIELAQDGKTVTMVYETTKDDIEGLIEDVYATTATPYGTPGGTATAAGNIQAGVSVEFDTAADEIVVTYTSTTAEDTYLQVLIEDLDQGQAVASAQLAEVGDSRTFGLSDGTTYRVTVRAVRDGQSRVIYENTRQL